MSIDIDHLKTWVGRERRTSEVLSLFPARALAAMLDHGRLPEDGEPLPPAWHWLYFLETSNAADTGCDGRPPEGRISSARPFTAADVGRRIVRLDTAAATGPAGGEDLDD